jgi:quinolinate synthase
VRDLQQYLGKFTENQKGTAISNCHIYIETESGHLEEIKNIEIQDINIIGHPEPTRMVLKTEDIKRFRSMTFKQS